MLVTVKVKQDGTIWNKTYCNSSFSIKMVFWTSIFLKVLQDEIRTATNDYLCRRLICRLLYKLFSLESDTKNMEKP